MVDSYGRWTYEPDTPENEKCDMDYVTELILNLTEKSGYEIKTDLENVTGLVIAFYGLYLDEIGREYYAVADNLNDPMINIKDVEAFLYDAGGVKEFDYYA